MMVYNANLGTMYIYTYIFFCLLNHGAWSKYDHNVGKYFQLSVQYKLRDLDTVASRKDRGSQKDI